MKNVSSRLGMLLLGIILLGASAAMADDGGPRGVVVVGRDTITGGTESSTVTLATPSVNTFYQIMGSITLNNAGVCSNVVVSVSYTNALGVATTTDLGSMGSCGSGSVLGGEFFVVYAKAGTPVSLIVTFTPGGSATYDFDAILVKQ